MCGDLVFSVSLWCVKHVWTRSMCFVELRLIEWRWRKTAADVKHLRTNQSALTRMDNKLLSVNMSLWTCPQMEHFMCTCGLKMAAVCACPLSPRDRRVSPFLTLAFRRVPLCALDPHFCRPALVRAHSRLLPDSQSDITSRKCGLRGRPRGFRVPFGTGPILLRCHAISSAHFEYDWCRIRAQLYIEVSDWLSVLMKTGKGAGVRWVCFGVGGAPVCLQCFRLGWFSPLWAGREAWRRQIAGRTSCDHSFTQIKFQVTGFYK